MLTENWVNVGSVKLTQCWLIMSEGLWHLYAGNFTANVPIIYILVIGLGIGNLRSELRTQKCIRQHQGQMNIQEVMHITWFSSYNKYSRFRGPTQRKDDVPSAGNPIAEMRQFYDHPTRTMGPQAGKALRRRHNDHDGFSIHQPHGCLLSR